MNNVRLRYVKRINKAYYENWVFQLLKTWWYTGEEWWVSLETITSLWSNKIDGWNLVLTNPLTPGVNGSWLYIYIYIYIRAANLLLLESIKIGNLHICFWLKINSIYSKVSGCKLLIYSLIFTFFFSFAYTIFHFCVHARTSFDIERETLHAYKTRTIVYLEDWGPMLVTQTTMLGSLIIIIYNYKQSFSK